MMMTLITISHATRIFCCRLICHMGEKILGGWPSFAGFTIPWILYNLGQNPRAAVLFQVHTHCYFSLCSEGFLPTVVTFKEQNFGICYMVCLIMGPTSWNGVLLEKLIQMFSCRNCPPVTK
jgi:hypothetical protein